ncbi:MAG: hypothetical protein H6739_24035 [Alphaproteobacteria bacterium]|nr:hypothetical protein [Alphaproteobacteria bacterium]
MARAPALMSLIPLATLLSGCVVVADNDYEEPAPVYNYLPAIGPAASGCYWDDGYRDFIWWFEAEVYDDDGPGDVAEVWADVYDVYGNHIETFRLYRETPDPYYWFSDWLQYSTNLDCYYGGYEIDIVAYDRMDDYDAVTIYPATWY